MLKTTLLAIIMIVAWPMGMDWIAQARNFDLSRFQWKNRLLLLFAPDRNHPLFSDLHQSLAAQQAEVQDRDLVVFEILETGPSRMNTIGLDAQAAQSLRGQLNVPQGEFTVILIGKDGGIKLNRQEQTKLKDIFGLIDAMPMRQEELRQKNK